MAALGCNTRVTKGSPTRLTEKDGKQITSPLLPKGLNIVGLNIRSLLPKIEQVECLLDNEQISVLSLTESWLGKNVSTNRVRIPEYKVYRYDREEKKKEEYVFLFTKS